MDIFNLKIDLVAKIIVIHVTPHTHLHNALSLHPKRRATK